MPKTLQTMVERRGAAAFVFAALVLGILVGLGAALLAWVIEWAETLTLDLATWTTWSRAVFFMTIPVGLFLSWLLNKLWGPGVSSGGVSETMVGLSLHGGYLPTRTVIPKILATGATLGSGGSGGREGPIVLIGATIGSSLARYTHFDHDRIRSLVAAGAGAGIAASFNAPIAGMLFAMEVILGSYAIRHLNAVVIACVSASVTTHLLIGEDLILTSPPHTFGSPRELLLYALLAGIAVAFGLLYMRTLDVVSRWRSRISIPGWIIPVLGGFAVAAIGILWPEALGTGRQFLGNLLALQSPGDLLWQTLVVIAVAKMVTTAFTRSSGGSAGSFMASLFIGGVVGAAFAELIDPLWTLDALSPGAFAIVGMACVLATTARAPLTAVVIVFEITGNYELVLPLMLGVGLAMYVTDRFHPDSAYTTSLLRQGIKLPQTEDIDLLDTVTVGTVMSPTDETLRPWNTLAEATEYFDISGHHGAAVFNDLDKLVGMLTLSDIAKAGGPSRSLTVSAAMSSDVVTISSDLPVSSALSRMATLGVGRIPVVAPDDPTKVVGMFRRASVVKAYDSAVSMSKGRELHRERGRIRSQPGADFFEVVVPAGSRVANATVAEIDWPANSVLVSIQRGMQVMVPHGGTILRENDTVVSFGSPEAHDGLVQLVGLQADEPSR
jgi:CIC family chloride channel protein